MAGCGGFGEDCRARYDNCGACAIGVLRGGLLKRFLGWGLPRSFHSLAMTMRVGGVNGWFRFLSLRGAAGDAAIPCLNLLYS